MPPAAPPSRSPPGLSPTPSQAYGPQTLGVVLKGQMRPERLVESRVVPDSALLSALSTRWGAQYLGLILPKLSLCRYVSQGEASFSA